MAGEAHLGLARICYEWNDLGAAEEHARQCAEVSRQMDSADTFISYAVFVARLRLAAGDVPSAVAILLEVLRLIGQGLSNQEIGARLFLALDTVKGHNRRIFGKLQVQRRTEAVARARELGLA